MASTQDPEKASTPSKPQRSLSRWGDPKQTVVVSWTNLVVKTKSKKVILNVSPSSWGPGLTSLMGPSGAGKSTLMNLLAYRIDGVSIEGKRMLNGAEYNQEALKTLAGYVLQFEILSETLTVEETLMYCAKLKMPYNSTLEQKQARVDEIMEEMGLTHTRHSLVGGETIRGLSGGERKRLSVGCEILTNPRVLFLDEPTSGLDSATSLSLCSLLHHLSRSENICVVATLHQPSAKIYQLFDNIMLLKAGETAYHGPPEGALTYFESLGHPCPPLMNPANFIMTVLTDLDVDVFRNKSYKDGKEVDTNDLPSNTSPPQKLDLGPSEHISWFREFWILCGRNFKEMWNGKKDLLMSWFVSMAFGLFFGGYRYDPNNSNGTYVLEDHYKMLFFSCLLSGLLAATYTATSFPMQRRLALKERASGLYRTSSYFCARVATDFIKQIPNALLYSTPLYWMVGFYPSASRFLIFIGFMILAQTAAMAVALATSAIFRTVSASMVVLPLALDTMRILSGFIVPPAFQIGFFNAINWLSYVFMTYCATLQNDFRGNKLPCNPVTTAGCDPNNSWYYIEYYGYDALNVYELAIVLVCYSIIFYFIAYVAIRVIKH